MAKTIANFLVGVGLDSKEFDKGAGNVETGLSRFRSLAGLAGTAIAGAFSLASLAAIRAGERVDKLALSTEKFNTSTQFIYNYGNALRSLGGSADEAIGAIAAAESALDQFRLKGNFGPFQDAVFAGVDVSALTQAANGEEFLRTLASIVPQLNKDQQRLLQESFGFSDATMRSLRQGVADFDSLIAKQQRLTGEINGATEAAREYNRAIADINTRIDGMTNRLSENMLPAFTKILDGITGFLDKNKDTVNDVIDVASASPVAAAVATGGALTGAAAPIASKIGLSTLGAASATLGPLGVIGGAGMMMWDAKETDAYKRFSSWAIGDSKRTTKPFANTYVQGRGFVTEEEAAQYRKEEVMAQGRASMPSASAANRVPEIKNNIDLNVTLNGRQLESTVTEIISRREYDTAQDLRSTVDR